MTADRFTVFALHALGGSGASFGALSARLEDDGIRVVPIDLAGFGDAAHDRGFTVDAMAAAVLSRIARDGAPRWLLLGHSMGGKVVSVVARRALAGVDPVFGLAGVVLLAGSPPTPEPMSDDKRQEMLGWAADGHLDAVAARTFVDQNTGGALPPDADARAIADVRASAPDAWRHWLTTGSRCDLSGDVGVLDIPAVILAGEEDADLGADAQPGLHGTVYPRARFVRLPGTGHFVPQERPDEVAREIARMCGEIEAHAPRVPDDWARLIASPSVEPRVRAALAARAIADDPDREPQALSRAQRDTLRLLADVVVPQPGTQTDGRIDLAARVDRQLAGGTGDGWRPADLPPDVQAARLALDAVGAEARRSAVETVERLVSGAFADPSSALTAAQLQSWFEDTRVDLVRHWLAHPASLARTGNDAFATRGDTDPLGFAVLGADLRAPWEPVSLGHSIPVGDERRPAPGTEGVA